MKHMIAPPGTNPMEYPDLVKRKRASLAQLILMIIGGIIALAVVCGGPIYLLTRNQAASAAGQTQIAPPTQTITSTPTDAPTTTATATQTPIYVLPTVYPTIDPQASPTAAVPDMPTLPPMVITKIVEVPVDRIQVVTVPVNVYQTQIVTLVVTATPEPTNTAAPTQTPWIIEITRDVIITQIVEVTPTPTETPSQTPTEEGIPEEGTDVPPPVLEGDF